MHDAEDHGTNFVPGAITARGPVSSITIHAHMRSGPHAILEHPLDLVVVVELLFLFGEQARRASSDEPLIVTPQAVLERLRERGVRSGNGTRLVGRDAVYESFARLRAKGYIRRVLKVDEQTGQRAGVAYEFYDWPAWNPDAPTTTEETAGTALSQVGPTSGNAGSGDAGSRKENRAKSRFPQVAPTSGNAGSGNAGSRAKPQVGSTSGNAGSPPHPPVGGGNTTPNPHRGTRAEKWAAACALHPDDYVPSDEQIKAAEEFLQALPGKWQLNVDDARALAPLLASRAHTQGRDLDVMLEVELMADDPQNPARVPSRVMPTRIRAIKRLTADVRSTGDTGRLAEWCGECNRGELPAAAFQRIVELPDGRDIPCPKCHPKHARASR